MNCSRTGAGYWLLVAGGGKDAEASDLGTAAQQTGDAQVFVDLGPVNAFAIAEQFKIMPLIRCGVQKSREPSQGNRDPATVDERNN